MAINNPQPIFAKDDTDKVIAAIDWLGREFTVGDTVMYCISSGRGQMMAIGKVTKLEMWKTGSAWGSMTRIRVQVLTSRTSHNWDNEVRTRPAWVSPMNVTVMPDDWLTDANKDN